MGPCPKSPALGSKHQNDEIQIPVDGVFIAIGHSPNTELFKGQLKMDNDGYLITNPDSTSTEIPGVYAAGDVQTMFPPGRGGSGNRRMAARK